MSFNKLGLVLGLSFSLVTSNGIAAVAWNTPWNGLSGPSLPANPVNGTGSPNLVAVSVAVFYKATAGGTFAIHDHGNPCNVSGGTWLTSMMSGTNAYATAGFYRYVATISIPYAQDVALCDIP